LTKIKVLILFILIISVSSCSTLRKSNINKGIINLSPKNKELINGLYGVNSLISQDSIKGNLYSNIFDRSYNKNNTIEYIELKTIGIQKY